MTFTLTHEQLARFKEICKSRMGIELDDIKAREQALKLLHLVALTRKPLPLNQKEYDA